MVNCKGVLALTSIFWLLSDCLFIVNQTHDVSNPPTLHFEVLPLGGGRRSIMKVCAASGRHCRNSELSILHVDLCVLKI